MSDGQLVTATYRVALERQADFLELMRTCERVMLDEGLITRRPFIRMRSKVDPTILIEIFEWLDATSFGKAQQNASVLEMWRNYEAAWLEGGFGLDQVPEASQPWAQFDPVD